MTIQHQRIAIAIVFFVNGFGLANLMSRLPEIQVLYQMNNAVLGTILFFRAAGALLAMPFAGWLGTRFSSGRITLAAGLAFSILLSVLLSMPGIWYFAVVIFLLGMAEGILDVNMNEQAVLVERAYKRPIMSSFHAVFSGGMALGAGVGAMMAYIKTPMLIHYFGITLLGVLLMVLMNRYFVKTAKITSKEGRQPLFLMPTGAILPLGIIAFCCMSGEGSMTDWSVLYMSQVLNQPESFAAMGLTFFNVAMFMGRTIGDTIHQKLGSRLLLIIDAAAAILGLTLVLIIPNPWVALFGFFIIGLGLSTIVPIVYSAAGNTTGLSPSAGIAMASSIGYAGFFVGPPVIGYLAEIYDLGVGLVFTLLLFLLMWGLITRRVY